jgi:oligopeptidase B
MRIWGIAAAGVMILMMSCTDKHTVKDEENMKISPDHPAAEKITETKTIHGIELKDDYAWLKDKERTEEKVLSHIRNENEYAKKNLKKLEKLEKTVYNEIVSKIDQADVSVPSKIDDYYYYSRDVEGEQYPVYCRKFKELSAPEEILLDLNILAKGNDYLELGVYRTSPDHRFLAYSLDTDGDEKFTLYIKYISRNTLFPETFENVSDFEWAEAKNAFFYATENETNRTDKVFRHVLGTEAKDDRLLYTEYDESFYVWIEKTKDRKYIFMGTGNKNTSEMHYMKSDEPMGFFELLTPRKQGVEYYFDHREDSFYILTNDDGAYNFKIMKAGDQLPVRVSWTDFLPHRADIYIDEFDLFKDFMAITEIGNAKKAIRLLDYATMESREISFDDKCHSVYSGSNPMFDTKKFRYVFESMTTPYSVMEYDIKTGISETLKQEKVLGGFDRSKYKSELVFASASDGTKIPVSLVYNMYIYKKDGTFPLLLEGYGAYGDFNEPGFSVSALSLLDRGFAVGIAHVRGGLEKGKKWHYGGMLLNKKNTFSDFIACAEYLVENNYTNKSRLIITGASAGGLLIGAVLNERPDLFGAAVLDVPFLDVLNTMLDPTLSATVLEYDEWGDPNKEEYFEYISSYCPYQNIEERDYPPILVLAGFHDPRVNYWEPAKWVAKLREKQTGSNQVLLLTTMSGHGGSSGRYDYYKEVAAKYSWIIHKAGIRE